MPVGFSISRTFVTARSALWSARRQRDVRCASYRLTTTATNSFVNWQFIVSHFNKSTEASSLSAFDGKFSLQVAYTPSPVTPFDSLLVKFYSFQNVLTWELGYSIELIERTQGRLITKDYNTNFTNKTTRFSSSCHKNFFSSVLM